MDETGPRRNNVTELAQYRKPMRNPILNKMLDHWERLRAGRVAPLRSEIDPRQIEDVLEYAFILERVSTGAPRFRIAGMRLCDMMGMEIRGMPAIALIRETDRARFAGILAGLFRTPEIIELSLTAPRAGRNALTAEMLLLPMKGHDGEVSRILGCLASDFPITDPPHRFSIAAARATRIIASDPARDTSLAGFAEDQHGFRPRNPGNKRGHLRLVVTDE